MSLPPLSRAARRRAAAAADTADAYADWRQRCLNVDQAYQKWFTADRARRNLAFWVYRSALDAEERAARIYADRVIAHLDAAEIRLIRELADMGDGPGTRDPTRGSPDATGAPGADHLRHVR